ncbi:MAG TPA: phosphatidate cytidylyltransferase [Pseudonocardiaceae bacterium]|nr:phosphatidate cytidylyltransferase [Pseudonocardiaceae bacterium]
MPEPLPGPEHSYAVHPAERPRATRAGRNLWAAIIVGVLMGAGILIALVTVRHVFIGIVAAAVAVSSWELATTLRRVGTRVTWVPVLLGGQAMVWLAWPFGRDGLLVAFVITALACLIWRFPRGADGYVRDVSASVFTVVYLPGFAAFSTLLVVPADGAARVLCLMLAAVASDIGGYVAGVLGGRHPMAPSISPKKSWEGFLGSLLAGTAAGALTLTYLLGGQPWQGVLFGAAIVVMATGGDLVESLIKRDLGVKDMSSLLPGHGGLLDRLDSLLLSAIVSWVLLSLFVPPGG